MEDLDYDDFYDAALAILEEQEQLVEIGDLTAQIEPTDPTVISSPKWVVEGPDGRVDIIYPDRFFAVSFLANYLSKLQATIEEGDREAITAGYQ